MMTKHLNTARALLATGQGKLAATTALALAGIGSAHASGTGGGTGADAAFSALESQASDFADSAWPVVIAVVGSLVAISMFKKFANRAS